MEESVVMARLSDLTDVSRQLKAKSDTLNDVIVSLNSKLSKLNLGVEVWLENYPIVQSDKMNASGNWQPTDPHRYATLLGYCRVEDAFQLAVKDVTIVIKLDPGDRQEYEEITDPCELKPLLKAPRNIRAEAMRLIPELLDSIKLSASRLLRSIEEAEKAAEDV